MHAQLQLLGVMTLLALFVFIAYASSVTLLGKNKVRERLKKLQPVSFDEAAPLYGEAMSPRAAFCLKILRMTGADMTSARNASYFTLARAGLTSNASLVYFVFFKRIVQPVLVLLAVAELATILPLLGIPDTGAMKAQRGLVGLLLLIGGLGGTTLYVGNRTEKRKKSLQKSFSDMLDLLLVCVETGLPLDGALKRVCKELQRAHPDITKEMERLRTELNVLNNRMLALQNLGERTDTPGFRILVASLAQAEKFGTGIADTLRVLAEEFRNSRIMDAEVRAHRIPALITLPIILFILAPFFCLILGPSYIHMQQQGIIGH